MKPLLFALLLLAIHSRHIYCQNTGKPILTRTLSKPYQLSYQCLCPFDFSGESCAEHRQIYCAITNTSVLSYKPEKKIEAEISFKMECFLKDIDQQQNETKTKINNFVRLPVNETQIKQMREADNYYIDESYQIIWANDTGLFDLNGEVIIPPGSTQTQSSILNKYHPYQFHYHSHFYGVPLTNAQISYHFQIVRFMNQSLPLPKQQISFKTQTNNNLNTAIVGQIFVSLQPQWQQYGIIRLQLQMEQHYGVDQRTYHRIGMNTGKWLLHDPKQPTPEFKQYGDKLPVTIWMILATVLMILLVVGSRLVLRVYNSYINRKNRKELLKQEENQAY